MSCLQTRGDYVGAVVFSVFMGWLRHALARLRQDVGIANRPCSQPHQSAEPGAPGLALPLSSYTADGSEGDGERKSPRARLNRWQSLLACGYLRQHWWLLRLVDALLFGAVSVVGFLNMLIVMAFNPGLMMSIVGGEMLGVLTTEPMGGLVPGESLSAAETAGRGCH
jgi:hypothetical protein